MRRHQLTIAYVHKRRNDGKNRREIIRCLKRHIAREIHQLLTNPPVRFPPNRGELVRLFRGFFRS